MSKIRILFYAGLLVIAAVTAAYFYFFKNSPPDAPAYINSLEECVRAGYLAQDTYPHQCQMPDGKILTD